MGDHCPCGNQVSESDPLRQQGVGGSRGSCQCVYGNQVSDPLRQQGGGGSGKSCQCVYGKSGK